MSAAAAPVRAQVASRQSHVIGEAPVPNATKGVPKAIGLSEMSFLEGKRRERDYRKDTAPFWTFGSRSFLVDATMAPTRMEIGGQFESNDMIRVCVCEVIEYASKFGKYVVRFSPIDNHRLATDFSILLIESDEVYRAALETLR